MYSFTSCTLWLVFTLLFCLSSGTPVPHRSLSSRDTHLFLPRGYGPEITDPATLTVGTVVQVPLAAADGAKTKTGGKKNRHMSVILGPAVDSLYPIAYISTDPTHTAPLPMTIGGIVGGIKPGWKTSAAMINMFGATDIARAVTTEEVEKLKKLRDGGVSRSPSPEPAPATTTTATSKAASKKK
ncbi:hypothetical protein C8J56DRAFT_885695 [Mycena floridula]|nr:hypothetical protein C8J56DRAFT_885695 [Mycena floridula]